MNVQIRKKIVFQFLRFRHCAGWGRKDTMRNGDKNKKGLERSSFKKDDTVVLSREYT